MGGVSTCCISLSVTVGSVRSSGETTLSLRRRKPPFLPAVTSVHLGTVVGVALEGFPAAVLAILEVFAEAVVLAKVVFIT